MKEMTVREVADALGAPERTVHNAIDRVLPGIKKNGVATHLNEEQVTAVSIEIKRAHNSDLATTGKVATTDLEMAEKARDVMAWMQDKIEALKAENSAMLPKAEFYDAVADSKTALSMRDVAAVLNLPGWGRNNIFAFLKGRGVLDANNVPYRGYQERGYFRVVERSWTDSDGEAHVSITTFVTQKGVDFIRKLICYVPASIPVNQEVAS